MTSKVSLTGIGTGVLLLVVMYYPLYIILPGNYVVEWSSGSPTLGIALSFLGMFMLLVGGLVTARVAKTSSRKQGALLGSAAGAIAGLILYLGLGAAAAGVAGSGNLLAHGPTPASGEEQLLILLAESVLRTVVWTYQVFWGLVLASATLGAIGGALTPPKIPDKSNSAIKPDLHIGTILAIAAMLGSGLSLWITAVIFTLLPDGVASAVDKLNYESSIPPASIMNWSVGTALAIFLIVMLCMLLTIRAESTNPSRKRQRAAKVAAYITVFLWLAIIGVLFLFLYGELTSPVFIVGAILSVIMGVQMLRVALTLRRRLSQPSLEALPDDTAHGFLQREYWRINFIRLSLGVSLASFLPILAGTVQSCLSLAQIPVRMILVLANYGPEADPNPVVDFTSRSLAHRLYVVNWQTMIWLFVITVVLVTLLILVLMTIGWIVSRLKIAVTDMRRRNYEKRHKIPASVRSLPNRWRTKLLAVASIFCLVGAIIGLIVGLNIWSSSVEPEPATYIFEEVFVAVAYQDIQEGTIIGEDLYITWRISPVLLIETWIAGDDEQDLKIKVVGCQARIDIQRALPLISSLLDCSRLEAAARPTEISMVSEADRMVMVYVPEGSFLMGSTSNDSNADADEFPQHEVYLNGFWIDRTEVTNAMFTSFLNEEGNQSEAEEVWLGIGGENVRIEKVSGEWQALSGYVDHPAVGVTWYGARAYCEWAGRRLPSEAEWEKAARSINGAIYPWGDEFDSSLANVGDAISCSPSGCDGVDRAAPVGSFPGGASPYGALDMAGNVWEWVADWYGSDYYSISPSENPMGLSPGEIRVLRGGAWNFNPASARAANRGWGDPDHSGDDYGFRCALDSSP
jgi:formylglycine-generating enzyme required for sulfatase activity